MKKSTILKLLFSTLFSFTMYILWAVLVKYSQHLPPKKIDVPVAEHKIITDIETDVYVTNEELKELIPSKLKISGRGSINDRVSAVMEEIFKEENFELKTAEGKIIPFIPNGSAFLGSYIVKDRAYLDFNTLFQEGILEERQEKMLIYSIVNSVTKLEGINEVKFLINGREIEKFYKLEAKNPFVKNM